MSSEHWPTYVLLSIYVLAMIIVTTIANRKNRNSEKENANGQNPSNGSVVTTHFLASKTIGPYTLLLTTFATSFSGYTVIGIPNEAGINGFYAIRWITAAVFSGMSRLILWPRIRRISVVRNYESPGDFIHDRYNKNKPLRCLVTLSLCIPQLLYLAVQVYSLGSLLEYLTDGELSFYWVIIFCAVLTLLFEALGGMRSVAYTDSVEAAIMCAVFIAISISIGVKYGGFMGQVVNEKDLPCDNSNEEQTAGCLNYDGGYFPTKPSIDVDRYYLRSPSSLAIMNTILFSFSGFAYQMNPHIIQRIFASKHDWQLKFVSGAIFFASLLCFLPGVLTGVTSISNFGSRPGALQIMLGVFQGEGGFLAFLAYLAMLAAIAGIMSSTDSALIGVSNTISCNLFKNWLTPNLEANKIVWIGKVISIITMTISVSIAAYLYESGADYGSMFLLQGGILWQVFPSYIFGLYTNINYRSVLLGIIIGLISDIILISIVFSDEGANDPFVKADPSLAALEKAWCSLAGVLLNIMGCAIGHWFFKWRDSDEYDPDNESAIGTLNIWKIKEIMRNVQEPILKYYGIPVYFVGLCVMVASFHWIGEIDPELINEYGKDAVKTFLYNGKIQDVIAGLPTWTFASIIWYIIGILSGVYAVTLWKVNKDEDNINHKIEMTKPDETNALHRDNKRHISLQSITADHLQNSDLVIVGENE